MMAIILAVVLSSVSITAVLYQTGKIGTKADTASSINLDNILQARSTTTSACNKNDTTCPSYQVSPGDLRSQTMANTVIQANFAQGADALDVCIENASQNKKPADLFGLLITSQGPDGGKCSIKFTKSSDTEVLIAAGYISSQNAATSLPLVYKSPASGTDFQGDTKLTQGTVKYDFQNFTSKGKYQNNKWKIDSIDISKVTGTGGINAAYEVRLTDISSLLNSIKSGNSDFVFDPKSSWTFTTSGTLKGSLDMSYKAALGKSVNYTINSATFCPDGCEININEKLDIKAQKKGLQDNIKGTISSQATHTETYKGVGAIDKNTNRIYWQDLTVKKADNRSWSHNLTYGNNTKVSYSGKTSGTALVQPLKNLSTVTSQVSKTNQVSIPFMSMRKITNLVYGASIDQTEKSENNKLVSRTGSGSYSFNNAASYSGIYDTISSQMLIKSSPTKSYLNTRRDPFSESVIAQYSPTYFSQGSFYVPGFFTALSSTATTTTLSTPARKALPKDFVFMESFSSSDSVWSKADKDAINKLIQEMKDKGANVTTYKTQSKKAMLAAYAQVPNGAWVLNAGHGLANGLNAGSEFVTYSEIMQILKDKQVKIDVFAAATCYAGRAPLSQTVIGSLGPLYTNPTGQMLQSPGSLLMNWNLASTDIVAALNTIAQQNARAKN